MKHLMILAAVIVLTVPAIADTFGTGGNAFNIDFVLISGDAGNLGSWSAGQSYTFSGVNHGNYRMGKYEITNDQWGKFKAAYGAVTGSPSTAYHLDNFFMGENIPANALSWYQAAQFVNYLNISTGHQAAYKFTGVKGTSNYTLDIWSIVEAHNGTNLYRHKEAFYFLPTEDEWVKAAYWNGTNLQQYATKPGENLTQGNGTSGTGWNYYHNGFVSDPIGPWNVGSGSQELNGTFDMMGNLKEWTESPYFSEDFEPGSPRALRGGSYISSRDFGDTLALSYRVDRELGPSYEGVSIGFRVASIPEPCTLLLLGLGGMILRRK